MLGNVHDKLTDADRDSLNGLVTEEEILKALCTFRKNKSPGEDGLSKEFYVCFWDELKSNMEELYNSIYLSGEMSDSMKVGIITLLLKKNDPIKLNNWRPISLLNFNQTILSKALVGRLRTLMSKLV
jgi:hypothetical protein